MILEMTNRRGNGPRGGRSHRQAGRQKEVEPVAVEPLPDRPTAGLPALPNRQEIQHRLAPHVHRPARGHRELRREPEAHEPAEGVIVVDPPAKSGVPKKALGMTEILLGRPGPDVGLGAASHQRSGHERPIAPPHVKRRDQQRNEAERYGRQTAHRAPPFGPASDELAREDHSEDAEP